MVINQNMIDTDRMAIKLNGKGKIVIKRHYLQDSEHYFVTFSKTSSLTINEEKIDLSNSLLRLYNMSFSEGKIELNCLLLKNMSLRTIYFATDKGTIDTYEASFIPEPEDPTISVDINFSVNDISQIITDPQMFKDMLNSNVVNGSAKDLAKYNLVPNFSLVIDDKIKLKK